MEIFVELERKEFIKALTLGSSFSGKNRVLPALDYVRLDYDPSYFMEISSNDGEMSVRTAFRNVKCDVNFDIFLDPKLLLSSLKSLKDDTVKLSIKEKTCDVIHANGNYSIPLGVVDEYPQIKIDEENTCIVVKSERLFDWINIAKNFVGSDELRAVMNGIYIYVNNGMCGVCASDGHKLYNDYEHYSEDTTKCDGILTPNAINTVLSMLNGTESATILFGERNMSFTAGDTSITCRKIEGRYPNFNAVIPQTHSIDVYVDKDTISESLNRVLCMANSSCLVKMRIDGLNVTLTAEDIDFSKKANDYFLATDSNKNITIGLKGIFFKLCLDAILSDNVKIEMTDHSRAIVLIDSKEPNKRILLMPMQII